MSEKRGNTGKLKFPFNAAGCLEIQLSNSRWHRVTANEFRSYNSPRRISEMIGKNYITKEYIGPVYLFGTNEIVDLKTVEKQGLIFPNDVDPRQKIKDTRPFGRL